ncbi:MAG: hypothetical protein QOI12_673 [Alphaproteobacteria bacterium]|nr:hypothetical protein [Alphaproteobacteria bacterium]
MAALVGAIAAGGIGVGSAAAADIRVPPAPLYQYGETQEYYDNPPVEQRYVYRRPPPVYVYPPPPPAAYLEYDRPPVVVVPEAYYQRRPYVYGGPNYGLRGRYVARRYAGQWRGGRDRW